MVYDISVKAETMFKAVGLTLNAAYAKALAEEIRAAIRRELIDLNTMLVDGNTITGQAMAIYFNVLEPGEKEAAFKMLKIILGDADETAYLRYTKNKIRGFFDDETRTKRRF